MALHPFFLALYSVSQFYAHNIGEMVLRDVLPIGAGTLAVSALVFSLCWLILGRLRAGLITTAILVVFLFYGHTFLAFEQLFGSAITHIHILPPLVLLLTVGVMVLVRKEARLRNATVVLNVVTAVLVLMPVSTIVSYDLIAYRGSAADLADLAPDGGQATLQLNAPDRKPHVFFLIMDRYAANRTLKDRYAFDNHEFEDFLRDQGFYVAGKSTANYLKTALSLAATFHMDYLDALTREAGRGSGNWDHSFRMIKGQHRVLRAFRKLGYRYVHLGSWWGPTRYNGLADQNYNIDIKRAGFVFSEAALVYMKGTLVPYIDKIFLRQFGLDHASGTRWDIQCKRIPYQFAKLKEVAKRAEPTFVFAHFLLPHGPYVFDEDGRCMSSEESGQRSGRDNYVGQVKYANSELTALVRTLLALEEKPVIIIQADEGPYPERFSNTEEEEDQLNAWRKASDDEFREKFRILNAMYLPGIDHRVFYSSISSVNTFRVVFSELFGADLPLLADRNFASPDVRHLYDFFEITDRIK